MNCFENMMKEARFFRAGMDFLLLYVRENGVFARRIAGNGARRDEILLCDVTEDTLQDVLGEILSRYRGEFHLLARSLSVVYALAHKAEIFDSAIRAYFRSRPETDSVERLHRGELFHRAAKAFSEKEPLRILYCGARETALYTDLGEIPMGKGITGGNGFEDYVLSFVENETDDADAFFSQIDRMAEIFRRYRYFSSPEALTETTDEDDGISKKNRTIYYSALSQGARAKVNRKPVIYRATKDRLGKRRFVPFLEAVKRYEAFFGELRNAEGESPSELILTGRYATFPLTMDFLHAFPGQPKVTYLPEELLVLYGMELSLTERISGARLTLTGLFGEEILLWDDDAALGGEMTEKRVSLPVLLRRYISLDEFRQGKGMLPYTMTYPGVRQAADGRIFCKRITKRGDLFRYCYEKCGKDAYRILGSEASQATYLTVTLGISATATGIVCHVLSYRENGEAASEP